ncbi:helix-turn-helix domain-containing protein [Nocardia abscessus]|uniref:helix-turn-helix domain-containing protein n=1 Tax=Nocardia TaxID=1817 RepID=UPI001895AFEA|nr:MULTISPECIES: helix-turn-helix domain-containing protein [Nocardia]MBF6218382.1 helix-turn-helix domain-containing protein [Nocardia abscessus]MDE1669927.1 helix-turn-helix domain-containing protein [Nocardia gipuzkoensis]
MSPPLACEIRLSIALAQAVSDRRTELELTQADLAEHAGLTQAKISRIEGSDTVPTLPCSTSSPTPPSSQAAPA